MADLNKEGPIPVSSTPSQEGAATPEDTPGQTENSDEFDPFTGITECIDESVDIDLTRSAPSESRFYHGQVDRKTAEELLRGTQDVGSYLIRESESKPGSYVLSFYGRQGISHFRITAMCGAYYIGGREFNSLKELIGYYTSWSDLLKEERLKNPVRPTQPVNDQREVMAILPYTKMEDTDELSFDKGEVFTVRNDMGDGWLWVTSKASQLSGIVYKEFMQDIVLSHEDINANGWFHDNITKEEAGKLLIKAGAGSYLIRPSDSTQGDFTLYVHCAGSIQKFKIPRQGRQFLMGGRFFESLKDIIERYSQEEIADGTTLRKPVHRDSRRLNNGDAQLRFGQNSDIYATMRQSSGSNFFLNRKDAKVVLKGHLNKKSLKTKKWKNMYFVLNETEQQLIYFENEKRSKPKGLIELSHSSIYPVHDSFFGRPNCFQLLVRELNHESYMYYYLCAESSDMAQKWFHELKKHCSNTAPKVSLNHPSPYLKQLRSLKICIKDAKKLGRSVTQPYCIVKLNNVQVCRTQAKSSHDPIWEEEFMLDDIPPDINHIIVKICNKSRRSKDTDIAEVAIPLCDLTNGEPCDKWHTLSSLHNAAVDSATIRLLATFTHEVVMPMKEYAGLKELLTTKELECVQALTQVCGTDCNERIALAVALLQICRSVGKVDTLIKKFNDLEIESEENTAQLFRAASWATTLMDQYMKMTATTFLRQAVKGTIDKIMDSKLSAEVNPAKLEAGADLEANSTYLTSLLNETVEAIFMSTDYCPQVLRYIFKCLQRKVMTKWPDDNLVKTRAVSGFVFLRLLCPAIMYPRSFNLITETPSATAANNLKHVAASLIKLANLVEVKEPHMEQVVKPFIKKNKQRMVMFLDELSNVPERPLLEEGSISDLPRHLACIHQICVAHLSDLKQLQAKQPVVKKLISVTEMLSKHKRKYMGEPV